MKTSSYIITADNIVELTKKANQLLDSREAKSIAHATFCKAKGASAVVYC